MDITYRVLRDEGEWGGDQDDWRQPARGRRRLVERMGRSPSWTQLAFRVLFPAQSMPLHVQMLWLFILAIPIASVAWTITHEEVFREAREYCEKYSKECSSLLKRKFFYVFTCEYCLSHWVTLFFVLLSGYRLLLEDWRGILIAVFALVWISNIYMGIFGRLRLGIKAERTEIQLKEEEVLARRR